jgi:hypothetical protein
MKKIKAYFRFLRQKYMVENKQDDIKQRTSRINYDLFCDLETEESLKVFQDVKTHFEKNLRKRLERIEKEKEAIENYFV